MNPLSLPKFLFCENRNELPGAGIVLLTKEPFIIGKVWKYRSRDEMTSAIARIDTFGHAIVPGYNICIHFGGTIYGEKITAALAERLKAGATMKEMAQFYLQEKIMDKQSWYNMKYSQDRNP